MNQHKKSEPKPPIAWCARCEAGEPVDHWLVGARFRCKKAKLNEFHVAAVIPEELKWFLWFEQALVSLTDSKWHPRVFLCKGSAERYGVLLSVIVLVALVGANRFPWIAAFLAGWVVVDLVVYSTRAAFVTQHPQVPLRNAIYGVIGFVLLAVSFAALYLALVPDQLGPERLTTMQALYFSLVTLATLGYGDIHPKTTATAAQWLVIAEVLIGLFYVAAILVTMVAWTNGPARLPTLERLKRESEL